MFWNPISDSAVVPMYQPYYAPNFGYQWYPPLVSTITRDEPGVKCRVALKHADLWRMFNAVGTEMIITKAGRRLFPLITFIVEGLEPDAHYSISVEFARSNNYRYKYSKISGWETAGCEDVQSDFRTYTHPDGTAKGSHWMSQPVNFNKLKLTNNTNAKSDQIILNSMHRYKPKIIITRCDSLSHAPWAPRTIIEFPEMEFIAVTAYQNSKCIDLKIEKNPFAKGFRSDGQSRSKRKLVACDSNDSNDDSEQQYPCEKKPMRLGKKFGYTNFFIEAILRTEQ